MKRIILITGLMLLLVGCGAKTTFETVEDVYAQPVSVQSRQMVVSLPEGAAALTAQMGETGEIYFCDGYTITVQVTQSGNLGETLRQTTGFEKEELQLIQTQHDGVKRYECVWVAAGEGEDQLGRAAVLDDGVSHYVLTCMTGASEAQDLQEQWQEIFTSFRLLSQEEQIRTGS